MVGQIVEQLPAIAERIAAPLAQTEKMVFISSDGKAGSHLTDDVARMMAMVPETVKGITGVDLGDMVRRVAHKP